MTRIKLMNILRRTRKNAYFLLEDQKRLFTFTVFCTYHHNQHFLTKNFSFVGFCNFIFRNLLPDWHWYLKPLKGFFYLALVETKDYLKRSTWRISLITLTTQLDSLLFRIFPGKIYRISFMMVNVKNVKFSSIFLAVYNFNILFF